MGPLSVFFLSNFFIKTLYKFRPNSHFNIILPSTPGFLKCSLSFKFLHQIPVQALTYFSTLIVSSQQPLGPLSSLFPSNFFIKTIYTSRPNPQFNIILPSTPGIPKCSLSFKFLHQIPVQALIYFPTLIVSSQQPLGPLSALFPSNFFIKTLYTSRPNPQFNIILTSTNGYTKCFLSFKFLHQNTLHVQTKFPH